MATAALDRVRALFRKSDTAPEYEPLQDGTGEEEGGGSTAAGRLEEEGERFSWFEYSVFLLLGIAMLWAWYGPRRTSKFWLQKLIDV